MSVAIQTAVWRDSKATGTAFLVLLKIADHAEDDGTNAWPSIAHLCKMCRCSETTVHRAIRTLQEIGELEVVPQAGGNGLTRYDRRPNSYSVLLDVASRGATDGVPRGATDGVPSAPRGATQEATGCHLRTNGVPPVIERGATSGTLTILEPSIEPSLIEPSIELALPGLTVAREPFEDGFAECWEHYPRKIARKKALRAYQASRRKGVTADALLKATKHYGASRASSDSRYTMYPSRFYGPDEPWQDYLDPVVATAPPPKRSRLDEAIETAGSWIPAPLGGRL